MLIVFELRERVQASLARLARSATHAGVLGHHGQVDAGVEGLSLMHLEDRQAFVQVGSGTNIWVESTAEQR